MCKTQTVLQRRHHTITHQRRTVQTPSLVVVVQLRATIEIVRRWVLSSARTREPFAFTARAEELAEAHKSLGRDVTRSSLIIRYYFYRNPLNDFKKASLTGNLTFLKARHALIWLFGLKKVAKSINSPVDRRNSFLNFLALLQSS